MEDVLKVKIDAGHPDLTRKYMDMFYADLKEAVIVHGFVTYKMIKAIASFYKDTITLMFPKDADKALDHLGFMECPVTEVEVFNNAYLLVFKKPEWIELKED